AGISEEEWQRLVQKHDDWVRRQQAQAGKIPEKSKGIGNVIKTFDPTKLGTNQNPNVESLNTGQFQGPPEFRDAQRRSTQPPRPLPPSAGTGKEEITKNLRNKLHCPRPSGMAGVGGDVAGKWFFLDITPYFSRK